MIVYVVANDPRENHQFIKVFRKKEKACEFALKRLRHFNPTYREHIDAMRNKEGVVKTFKHYGNAWLREVCLIRRSKIIS